MTTRKDTVSKAFKGSAEWHQWLSVTRIWLTFPASPYTVTLMMRDRSVQCMNYPSDHMTLVVSVNQPAGVNTACCKLF